MRWTLAVALAIAATLIPATHGRAFAAGTASMLALAVAMAYVWPRPTDAIARRSNALITAVVAALGLSLLWSITTRLLVPVFAGPLDPNRGDMLVIIEHAIAAFLAGGNPYAIHHVPWDAPLSYGPVLWMPFIVPHALRVDLRILTLTAQLFVPAALLAAGAIRAGEMRVTRALGLFALAAALLFNPEMLRFHEIGQTQIYWPLLLVFCVLLAHSRWTAAAICLGLLVAARTTMLAIVPVFFLYLAVNRLLTVRHVLLFVSAAAVPFLPFVIMNPGSVAYALFGVYIKVMKTFVWHQTTWAVETYGITGRLLEHGLERYVEAVQIAAMLVTCTAAWRSMRRGARLEPWAVLSLLVFSMTTLWPVIYVYFDVWVLAASALFAYDDALAASGRGRIAWTAIAGASIAVVLAAAAQRPGASYALDVGDPRAAGYTGGGFGRDEAVVDEGRSAVWIEGETARVRLPRAGWRGATVRIAIRPNIPQPGLQQRVAASLNGRSIGMVRLDDRWQEISFATSRRDWNYGFNVLDLSFAYALPSAAPASDRRALSAAIDRIVIE
jgi:hypothetical protein